MDRLAFMPQGGLSEALGVAAFLGALGPGVAVAVEADAVDFQELAAALEFAGAVFVEVLAPGGEEGAALGKLA